MVRRGSRLVVTAVLLLAAALLVIGGASFARRVAATQPLIGVSWTQSSRGPLALSVEPATPAEAAGVRAGDVLVSVDGRRVESALDAAQLGWDSADAAPRQLRLQRGDEMVDIGVSPRRVPQSEIYIYLSVVGLAFWASGLFIALRWPNVRGGVPYALLALALFTQLVFSHTGRADTFDWVVYWVDLATGAMVPALLLHLAVVLSRRTIRHGGKLIATAYGVSATLTGVSLWLGRGGAYRFDNPVRAMELRDRMEPLVLAFALICAAVILVKSFERSASVLHRSQMRWLLWGLGLGLGPSVMFYAVPFALGAPELPSWAVFLTVAPMLFVPAAFTAALARYRLHDLDLLLVRGLTEVSAVIATFAVYAAAAFLLREGVGELVPISRSLTRYVGFFVAATLYTQLRIAVRAGVEKAFYRKRYSYRATLLDWARELNTETDLPSLLSRLRERIRATLGIAAAEVLIQRRPGVFEAVATETSTETLELGGSALERMERESYLSVVEDALPAVPWARYLFPLRVKGTTTGILAVAERHQPEEPLSTEDRALLSTLAAHAASAIETARLVLEVRQRAAEVERLHARQERILEGSAVGLLFLDEEGTIRACNRAVEKMYGLSREEAIGRRLNEVFPLAAVRRIESEARQGDRAREQRIFRMTMVNREGQRVVVNVNMSSVAGGNAEEGGRVLTFDDVTERVKLEEQVLRQERLASLGLLAAGVAHEINTPLTGISSYTQLLLEELPEDDVRRPLLHKIETQTQRASRITGSLLNLARPENTALEMLDVNATVLEVLQLFEPQVRGNGIQLRTQVDERPLMIRGHKGKLQQVLLNLLINARDAVGSGGVITMMTHRRDDKAIIEVMDDGTGIADEDIPRIFDPFFTTKGRTKGTGLGLAISYGIIREHGGEIHVESSPSEFTRFRVELPYGSSAQALA